jgi:putative iron-only hydrogenase system regulator
MERRLGAVILVLTNESDVQRINSIISEYSEMILGRQGIPLRDRSTNVISLVLEGDTDRIGALTGKLGRLKGVRVKSVLVQ